MGVLFSFLGVPSWVPKWYYEGAITIYSWHSAGTQKQPCISVI